MPSIDRVTINQRIIPPEKPAPGQILRLDPVTAATLGRTLMHNHDHGLCTLESLK